MPAAAVIPALIAYINAVAVKKLVVEIPATRRLSGRSRDSASFSWLEQTFTVNKIECLKQAIA